MEKFINDHPFISLFALTTVCNAIVQIIRPDAFKTVTTVRRHSETNNEEIEDDSDLS